MTGVPRPEAHLMDINTVNLWLTNAKHQPTKSVEIEGTPATRQASLTEFFTSVATSAAFQVGAELASNIINLDVLKVNNIGAKYGTDSFLYKAADGILATKTFVKETTSAVVSSVDDFTKPITETFEAGYNAAKSALVNPLSNQYTEAIVKATSAAADFVTQASSLAAVGIDDTAMLAAKQFSDGTAVPTLQGVKDHSDNLTQGNFTLDNAVVAAAPSETSMVSIWTANTNYTSPEYEPVTNNDILRALGFEPQPTFEDMCGIFTKQQLHDNLQAAIEDEEDKRNAITAAVSVQDKTDAYLAWQASFDNYKNCVLALRSETRNNQKKITQVIAQENSLAAISKVNTTRNLISDPAVLAVYDSCLTANAKKASDALDVFVQGPPTT